MGECGKSQLAMNVMADEMVWMEKMCGWDSVVLDSKMVYLFTCSILRLLSRTLFVSVM